MASGFQSLRRFNALLKERYRMTPSELRKQQRRDVPERFPEFSFRLSYRPPLDWTRLLNFLSARAIPGVESVNEGAYTRTVAIQRQGHVHAGHLEVRHAPAEQMLLVRLSDELLPVCAVVLERLKRLFDLNADPAAIEWVLGGLAKGRPGLRVPGSFDGFEMSVRAILGQQVTVVGASTLAGRFVARFGTPLAKPRGALTHLFPAPERIAKAAASEIAQIGLPGKRAETLRALAQAMASGALRLEPGGRVEETMAQLVRLPGIGEWTAQYIAMRALSWPDAFPHTDLGIQKALAETNPKKTLEMAERWRPWRAYAALHLWASLEKKS
jgi:AraC family transcriptional regulator of adaptative response / DNA-3-methyladenine glycosylase II